MSATPFSPRFVYLGGAPYPLTDEKGRGALRNALMATSDTGQTSGAAAMADRATHARLRPGVGSFGRHGADTRAQGGVVINVVLVDDHPIVREGVAAVLSCEDDVRVVGSVGTAEEAFRLIGQTSPDVVIIDVRLNGVDGIDACEIIVQTYPGTRVIVLTRLPGESVMMRAFAAGARGFLIKESDPSVLRQAVRTVAEGSTYADPRVTGTLIALATKGRRTKGPYGLTLQELRVVELLPKGLTNREIGRELSISEQTVKTHLRNAMQKLQAGDRAEAAAIVARDGLG